MNERPERQPPEPNLLYAAFLVRCWREREQWRIVLEDVARRQRSGFSTFEVLVEALQTILKKKL